MAVVKDVNGREIHVGDRVRVLHDFDEQALPGKCGTVVQVKGVNWTTDARWDIGVVFDENMNGHDLDGVCTRGYGRWGFGGEVEVMSPHLDKIKIEFNDLFN